MVETVRADGSLEHSVAFMAPIVISASGGAQAVKVSGFGLLLQPGSGAAGYFRSQVLRPDPSCDVILIGNTDEQLQRFVALMGQTNRICHG